MRNDFQLHVILFFTGGDGRFFKVAIKTDSMHFKMHYMALVTPEKLREKKRINNY